MDKYQENNRKVTSAPKNKGEASKSLEKGNVLSITSKQSEILREESKLMEAICTRENLNTAYKHVVKCIASGTHI